MLSKSAMEDFLCPWYCHLIPSVLVELGFKFAKLVGMCVEYVLLNDVGVLYPLDQRHPPQSICTSPVSTSLSGLTIPAASRLVFRVNVSKGLSPSMFFFQRYLEGFGSKTRRPVLIHYVDAYTSTTILVMDMVLVI